MGHIANSIIQTNKECFICGDQYEYGFNKLEEHHIFFGNPNRSKSEHYGLKVWLCGHKCHRNGHNAPHRNKTTDTMLKSLGQAKFEEIHGDRDLFRKEFGKSYL